MPKNRRQAMQRGRGRPPKRASAKQDGISTRAAAGLPRERWEDIVDVQEMAPPEPEFLSREAADGALRSISGLRRPPWSRRAKKHDERSLMDDVHALTFQEKAFSGVRLSPATRNVMQTIRTQLRRAEKFTLDDDAVRLICRLSHEEDRLEGWSLLARIPYDVVWFEYDGLVKLREFEAMGTLRHKVDPEESVNRFGYLFFRDTRVADDKHARWICHVFGRTADDGVMPDFVAYVYDPEGDGRAPLRGSNYWQAPTLSLRPGFPRMPFKTQHGPDLKQEVVGECDAELMLTGLMEMQSGTEAIQLENGKYQVTGEFLKGPEWMVPRVAAIVDPWWDTHLGQRQETQRETFHKIMMTSIAENRGHLRWLITMLASINGLPRDIRFHAPRIGRHSVGMHQIPYFGSSTIELTIPRENRLIHARKILDRETHEHRRRRRHGVMGHWRIVERSKVPRGVFCSHIPALVEGDLAVCEKCGLLVRYIHNYERGDESLGYVRHNYEVKT